MERHFPLSQMQLSPSYWLQIPQQCTASWHIEYHWFSGYWPTTGYFCQGLIRTFAIILENTGLGSTANDDQDSLGAAVSAHEWHQPWLFSACYSFHMSLCFPVCYSRHWMKPPHLGAGGQSLSPTGPSKTAPADGAFTFILQFTVLWKMTSQASALF